MRKAAGFSNFWVKPDGSLIYDRGPEFCDRKAAVAATRLKKKRDALQRQSEAEESAKGELRAKQDEDSAALEQVEEGESGQTSGAEASEDGSRDGQAH